MIIDIAQMKSKPQLLPADASQKPLTFVKLTDDEKKVLTQLFQNIYCPETPKATDEDIRDIQEQLRETANDPNLVIRSGGHW